jgi:hypothetical protein
MKPAPILNELRLRSPQGRVESPAVPRIAVAEDVFVKGPRNAHSERGIRSSSYRGER